MANVETTDAWIEEPDKYTSKAMVMGLREVIKQIGALNANLNKDMLKKWMKIEDAAALMMKMAIDYPMPYYVRQEFLELDDIEQFYHKIVEYITEEINIFRIKEELAVKVRDKVEQNQKEYILREQMKVLSQELDGTDSVVSEADEYTEKLEKLNASEEIKESIRKEIKRFRAITCG